MILPNPYAAEAYATENQRDAVSHIVSDPRVGGDTGDYSDRGLSIIPPRVHGLGADTVVFTGHRGPGESASCRRSVPQGPAAQPTSVAAFPDGTVQLIGGETPGLEMFATTWDPQTIEAWLYAGRSAAMELVDADLCLQASDLDAPMSYDTGWSELSAGDLAHLAGSRITVTRTPNQATAPETVQIDSYENGVLSGTRTEVVAEGKAAAPGETLAITARAPGPFATVDGRDVDGIVVTHHISPDGWGADSHAALHTTDGGSVRDTGAASELLTTGHHYTPVAGGPSSFGLADTDALSAALRACARLHRAALQVVAPNGNHRPEASRDAADTDSNPDWSLSDITGMLTSSGSGTDTRMFTVMHSGELRENHH